ncbi:MAG: hypothetical protein H6741_33460 [Alphaproteobacteria bacterium]|nr:hypothetical protein [Alphaproteobacteria bacterium]
MCNAGQVVALLGGDGGRSVRAPEGARIRRYPSVRQGGNGAQRRLMAALKAGTIDRVWLDRRLGHAEVLAVRRLCRARGIPVEWLDP